MKKLKSERHHWWPICLSKHWAGSDGKTGCMRPDGTWKRLPPASLGVIGNGHHIKLGNNGEPSPWDQSFERAFDKADSNFPELIKWLEGLKRNPVRGVEHRRDRFIPHECTDDALRLMTECAVSLAVRGPMNREACVRLPESLRGPIPSPERNALIGLNMRNAQRLIADTIAERGKFVAVYSQNKEFIYGDGFFHNVSSVTMPPQEPKMFVPITPHISIVVCKPSKYTTEPKLFTLVLEDQEVDICNHAVQIYSKDFLYFRSQEPMLHDDFRCIKHLRFSHPNNPIDTLISSIPGVSPRGAIF